MADTDDMGLDDAGGDGGSSSPSKGKGVGGLLPVLLKWVAIALGAIILIGTVSFFVVKLVTKNQTQVAAVPVTEDVNVNREILDWYTSLGTIRTKTNDANPASVVVEVVLGYKHEDKACSTEITQRNIELKDYLRRCFTGKTVEELKPDQEESLQLEIRNYINDSILSSSKIKAVRFMQLDVVQQ